MRREDEREIKERKGKERRGMRGRVIVVILKIPCQIFDGKLKKQPGLLSDDQKGPVCNDLTNVSPLSQKILKHVLIGKYAKR